MEFSEWITRKYIEWRGDAIGQDRSITEFATTLHVSQSLMTQWMKKGGKKPRNQETITKLLNVFGNEVYEVLGFPKPDYEEVNISSLPEELQNRFKTAMSEIDEALKERELSSESEEGMSVIRETFGKYGFAVTIKENSG